LILVVSGLRYSQAELPFATPIPIPTRAWVWLTAFAAAASVVAFWWGLARSRKRQLMRPFLELFAFHPLLFAFIGGILPPSEYRHERLLGIVPLAVLVALLLRWNRHQASQWGFSLRHFGGAIRLLAWPSLIMVILTMALALTLGLNLDIRALALNLLIYPFYSFGQMVLFAVLPIPRFRQLSRSKWSVTLATTLLFFLVHWPNVTLMLACLLAMPIWAFVYLHRPNVWALALSMGIVASFFAQTLPDRLTHHMRIGPAYVRNCTVTALASCEGKFPEDPTIVEFIREVYPAILSRPATKDELKRWDNTVAASQRIRAAWQIFASEERREKFGSDSAPLVKRWTELAETWRQRVAIFGSEEYFTRQGGNFTGFLQGLYQDILERTPSQAEVNSWPETLTSLQRERIVEVILATKNFLKHAEFDTLEAEDLKFP
jgi:hypothetical protein